MRFKGTFALLVIAIMFGGYVYFYEYKGGEKREAAKKTEKRIWQFDAEDIVRVDLTSHDGDGGDTDHMTAERDEDGRWKITAPKELTADSDQLNRLASYAARLDRENVVDPSAGDLSQFGLSPARLELRLTAKDGREYGISFGENNPSGNFTYSALAGGKEVFLVSADAARSFDAKTDDFRNRNVISFDRAGVEGVILRNPEGVIELDKDRDDRWWFRGPEKREAGGPAVRELLNALNLGKISEFFDENVEDYKNASLDKPVIDVVLTFGPGKALKRLVIGAEKSKLRGKPSEAEAKDAGDSMEIFLARDDSRGDMFFVEKDLVDKLSKSASDIRDKALVPFQRWDVDAITLENSNGKFQFVKTDGDWFLDGPSKQRANWNEINNILDTLEKPVVEWIDNPASLTKYGLEAPAIRVVLRKGNATIAECAFGSAAANGVYAKVSGDSSIKVAGPEGLEVLEMREAGYLESAALSP
ncbi:MAG: DUF4340 domain-containing protein [Acidobacteriota bacterium]|jgi:hypothetical protein|nr:DUF4340 domain-containing protein [Acidobacteriota bacterium]